VTAGLALVPPKAIHRYTLQLEPGLYRERVTTAGKGPLSLVGLGPAAEVVIIFGCSANNGTGQPGCRPCPPAPGYAGRATLTVGSADFAAVNLTLADDACGYDAGHAAQSERRLDRGRPGSVRAVQFLRGAGHALHRGRAAAVALRRQPRQRLVRLDLRRLQLGLRALHRHRGGSCNRRKDTHHPLQQTHLNTCPFCSTATFPASCALAQR